MTRFVNVTDCEMVGFVNVTNRAMNDRVCECDGLCNDSD